MLVSQLNNYAPYDKAPAQNNQNKKYSKKDAINSIFTGAAWGATVDVAVDKIVNKQEIKSHNILKWGILGALCQVPFDFLAKYFSPQT